MKCLLCQHSTKVFLPLVHQCIQCGLTFKDPSLYLSILDEQRRYATHQNDVEDLGYENFLNKLVIPLKDFLPKNFTGLDFGCGPGPFLAKLLKKCHGDISLYDPQFFPDQVVLTKSNYDVVTCTEVAEHFKNPETSFELIISLIKPRGLFGLMTKQFSDQLNYETWYYKNDPTHIVFYSEKTIEFLAAKFSLDIIFNDHDSVVIFRKREMNV